MTTASPTAIQLRQILLTQASPERAEITRKFFKTAPGTYGEHDQFIGITIPKLRYLIKPFHNLKLDDCEILLADKIHEIRFAALLILIHQFTEGSSTQREKVFDLYRDAAQRQWINNWDLVDFSAPEIAGSHELDHPGTLTEFLHRSSLWEKRIAIVGSGHLIQQDNYALTLKMVTTLLDSPHDLLHKACGWMLREIGKRDVQVLQDYLALHYTQMPRTMLRYAIEKFPESQRRTWLQK